MPKLKKRPPDFHVGDDIETNALIGWLQVHKVPFVRYNRYHLRIRHLNYYIGRGTIFYDGELAPEDERGIDAFKEHLHRMSFMKTGNASDFSLDL